MTSLIKSKNGSAKIDRFTKPDSGKKSKTYDWDAGQIAFSNYLETSQSKSESKRLAYEKRKQVVKPPSSFDPSKGRLGQLNNELRGHR